MVISPFKVGGKSIRTPFNNFSTFCVFKEIINGQDLKWDSRERGPALLN